MKMQSKDDRYQILIHDKIEVGSIIFGCILFGLWKMIAESGERKERKSRIGPWQMGGGSGKCTNPTQKSRHERRRGKGRSAEMAGIG